MKGKENTCLESNTPLLIIVFLENVQLNWGKEHCSGSSQKSIQRGMNIILSVWQTRRSALLDPLWPIIVKYIHFTPVAWPLGSNYHSLLVAEGSD